MVADKDRLHREIIYDKEFYFFNNKPFVVIMEVFPEPTEDEAGRILLTPQIKSAYLGDMQLP
jgi:hypothetical protein